MKYKVKRAIEKGKKRYEAGAVVETKDLKGWPIKAWLVSGVLEAVKDGDG
jgi:hypothetical protein